MKILQLSIIILILSACSNEFTLIEEPKDIPIVYGLIDLTDTAQYIRLERAFVDETTSALDLAMDPNNLYYPNAEITLINDSDETEYKLSKVDGDNEGLPRREGVFAQSPNTLYKILSDNLPLEPGLSYTLSIKRDETLPLVTANTTLVEEGRITRPTNTGSIDFDYITPTNFRWSRGDFTAIYDMSLVLHYQERDIAAGTGFVRKSLVWDIVNNSEGDEAEIEGIRFYEFMRGNIEADPNFIRRFLFIDVILYSGGEEIKDYIKIGQANLGITSSQDIPTFTNLSEGRGLFSSRTELIKPSVDITAGTLDSLVNGSVTAELNFEL